ncbi:uncharacterized protein EI97DRAFT_19837 [Westerdykella ornata]|uniref:Uncharacterized protein n=1 Tax=Westerdykella ornata TaxID=318751 RepID=A0A6A6JZ98_WESOR|nr:uncharacterized protein EI97DRAFT_19837 [Westerdykella ornata]KAF2281086.1 hypothetical protein EI97DRAFT_19837 [Westerdykella ornata]
MAPTRSTHRRPRTTAQAQRRDSRQTGVHTQAQQTQPRPISQPMAPAQWRKSSMPMHRYLYELLYPFRDQLSDDDVMSVAVNISTIIKATNITPIDNERISVAITHMRAAVLLEDEYGNIKVVLAEPRLQFENGVVALANLATKFVTRCLRGAPDSDTEFRCGMWVAPVTNAQQERHARDQDAGDEDDEEEDETD